jgi:hypothetical protein
MISQNVWPVIHAGLKVGVGRMTAAAMTKNVASLGRDFMPLHLPEVCGTPPQGRATSMIIAYWSLVPESSSIHSMSM